MGTSNSCKIALCREACPAGIDVPRYLRHVREARFGEALAVIREKIPFPSVCGYACVHPCETKCARNQLDEPLAIRLLKRAAAQLGGDLWKQRDKTAPPSGKSVAVIGAGPAGLTAAYYLAKCGHKVTVYEALPEPGGMMRYGIPEYRLPKDVLAQEIEEIKAAGVEIRTNSSISSLAELQKSHDAVFVACGAWQSLKLGIEGEDLPGVLDGLSFLRAVNMDKPVQVGRRVAVIGGGNTAIDAARTSIRLGVKEVTLIYRRTRDEMPASSEEIEDALEEGAQIEFLAAPVKISQGEAGLELTCQRMQLGPRDASGRPQPVPIKGSEFNKPVDTVIVAIGQKPGLPGGFDLVAGDDGRLQADSETLETRRKGVFGGGDVLTGPASIIEAIAQGRQAASSIDRFLGGDGNLEVVLAPLEESLLEEPLAEGSSRPYVPALAFKDRVNSFNAVELGLDEAAARKEARRCLSCDLRSYRVEVDGKACKECGYCAQACTLGVFDAAEYYNEKGYKPMFAAHPERCIGCLKCFFICPDFAINIVAER